MGNVIYAADLFCGAGGTSTGLLNAAQRLGKSVKLLAINHWQVAIDTHQANHPGVRHLTTGLESVTPELVVPNKHLDLLWASPSCTHHSVARGGRPRCDQSRAQPSLLMDWLDQLYVKRVMIENVPEFVNWGPLGYNGKPLKSKRGALFQDYLRSLEARGYKWEWRILCCADYGDATTRERFFLQAVKGRERIRWPEPTHAKNPGRLFGDVQPWVPAWDIIDWSIPGKSIFTRDRPLAANTLRRIEAGIRKFWGEWAEPFLILLRGTRNGALERTALKLDTPLPTLTGGGHVGLVQPYIIHANNGRSTENPNCRVRSIEEPIGTQTGSNAFGLVQSFILPQLSCGANRGMAEPLPATTTAGAHALVEPFIVSFYGTDNFRKVSEPVATVTVKDRFGLVQQYGLDILFRMLQPHELAAAHSFPKGYFTEGTKTDVVKQIGNSVPCKTSKRFASRHWLIRRKNKPAHHTAASGPSTAKAHPMPCDGSKAIVAEGGIWARERMNMAERTPGKLGYCGSDRGGCNCGQLHAVNGKDRVQVAICHGGLSLYPDEVNPSPEEMRANMNFLCQAWNCHEMLVKLAKEYRRFVAHTFATTSGGITVWDDEIISNEEATIRRSAAIDAVLAQAEGRE